MKNIKYISAGAGSGKTFALTEILSNKLSGKDGEIVKPSEVILTTFTVAAANEFREKARMRLINDKNLKASIELDSAKIGTVHSIANLFINRYWYLLGRGSLANVISSSDKNFFINQSLSGIVSSDNIEFVNEFFNEFNVQKKENNIWKSDSFYWREHLLKVISIIEDYNIDDLSESISKSKEIVNNLFSKEVVCSTNAEIINLFNAAKSVVAEGKKKKIEKALLVNIDSFSFIFEAQKVMSEFVDKDKNKLKEFNFDSIIESINVSARASRSCIINNWFLPL